MPTRPFCFVHASDLHLEQAVACAAALPEALRATLVTAAERAATRIFDLALTEQAEFLVLAGDIVAPWRAGPRGPLFVARQCQRLAQAGIAVYWAGGEVDPPDDWPTAIPLPTNVHWFPPGRVDSFIHQCDGRPLARLVGQSHEPRELLRPAEFRTRESEDAELFAVAVAHADLDAAELAASDCDYWALGGRHATDIPTQRTGSRTETAARIPGAKGTARQVAHYPGTHQGRRPDESGPHGATLVRVDSEGRVRVIPKPFDVVRWQEERIVLEPGSGKAALETALRERLRALESAAEVELLLVTWSIAAGPSIASQLRRGTLAAELLDGLRREVGLNPRGVVSVGLEPETPAGLPRSRLTEETLAGEFARALEALEQEPASLDLSGCVEKLSAEDPFRDIALIRDPHGRQRVLREAAALGMELLTAEGPTS